jgi:hypothetical protein
MNGLMKKLCIPAALLVVSLNAKCMEDSTVTADYLLPVVEVPVIEEVPILEAVESNESLYDGLEWVKRLKQNPDVRVAEVDGNLRIRKISGKLYSNR